jgi:multidrug resistance efflux pump
LKINSPNSPKPIVSKISGKLVKLLVVDNQFVKADQPLAYLESTADHKKVLVLLIKLKNLQQEVLQNKPVDNIYVNDRDNIQFGEFQSAYQQFIEEYLLYRSSVNNGFLVKKKTYLQKDLVYLDQQQTQLKQEKSAQQKDFDLASEEYEMHKKLENEKVKTRAELHQEESKYLAKKTILFQTESALISENDSYSAKQSEILELDNQMQQERAKFLQALNSLISTAQDWKSRYVLTASQPGKISFAGIIQENQVLTPGQEVFYVNPGNEAFFGEMAISQMNMGKVKVGQQVLIKLKSFPFEEYGMIRGKINYISDVPFRDSVFMAKVDFKIKKSSDLKLPISLKQGMTAIAEIVTQDATVLQRLKRSFLKIGGGK